MLYISLRPNWAGGLSISGVDVIVCSCWKGLSGTSLRRISVNNVRAFFYVCTNIHNINYFKKPTRQWDITANNIHEEIICPIFDRVC